jgi:hypothetical protein
MVEGIYENNNTHKPLVSGPNPLVATNYYISFITPERNWC